MSSTRSRRSTSRAPTRCASPSSTARRPGNDQKFNAEKLENARNFANKLWNAARFVLGARPASIAAGRRAARLPTRRTWAPPSAGSGAACAATVAAADRALATSPSASSRATLYDAIWGEYCDWGLELAKVRLGDDVAAGGRPGGDVVDAGRGARHVPAPAPPGHAVRDRGDLGALPQRGRRPGAAHRRRLARRPAPRDAAAEADVGGAAGPGPGDPQRAQPKRGSIRPPGCRSTSPSRSPPAAGVRRLFVRRSSAWPARGRCAASRTRAALRPTRGGRPRGRRRRPRGGRHPAPAAVADAGRGRPRPGPAGEGARGGRRAACGGPARLADERFTSKAPPPVVEGARAREAELAELGATRARLTAARRSARLGAAAVDAPSSGSDRDGPSGVAEPGGRAGVGPAMQRAAAARITADRSEGGSVPLEFLKRKGRRRRGARRRRCRCRRRSRPQEYILKLYYAGKSSEGVRLQAGPRALAELPVDARRPRAERDRGRRAAADRVQRGVARDRPPVRGDAVAQRPPRHSPITRHALSSWSRSTPSTSPSTRSRCALLDGEVDTSGYPDYSAIVGGVASHWDEATGDMLVRAVVGWGGRASAATPTGSPRAVLGGLFHEHPRQPVRARDRPPRPAGSRGRPRRPGVRPLRLRLRPRAGVLLPEVRHAPAARLSRRTGDHVPIYDYVCSACGHRFEVLRGLNEAGPRQCPRAGGP